MVLHHDCNTRVSVLSVTGVVCLLCWCLELLQVGDEVGADCSILGSLEDPSLPGSKTPDIKQRFQVCPVPMWAGLLAGASIRWLLHGDVACAAVVLGRLLLCFTRMKPCRAAS